MIRVKESDKKLRDVLMLVMNWWVMILKAIVFLHMDSHELETFF